LKVPFDFEDELDYEEEEEDEADDANFEFKSNMSP
jgi:hypothetical protein